MREQLAHRREFLWLSAVVIAVEMVGWVDGEGCAMRSGLCLCDDADGDQWDLTPLAGDHTVSGPGKYK